jgi:hypothetical protein
MINVKFLMLNILSISVLCSSEYEAKKITKVEYQDLQMIDKNIYELSVETKTYDTKKVANFIYANLAYDLDFTRLKITSSANLRHSSSDTVYNATDLSTDRNSYSTSVNFTYPLFDKKESNDRKKQIIVLKQKIIKEVQNYFKLKAKLHDLKIELKILTALEIRAKARKLDGVDGFKDWLDVIKDIKKVNYDLTLTDLELKEKMQTLMSYIIASKQQILKDML